MKHGPIALIDEEMPEIHHLPWLINDVELKSIKCNYPRFKTLLNNKPEKIQYSKGVKVLAWGKNRIEK